MSLRTLGISLFIFGLYSRFHLDIGPLFFPFFLNFISIALLFFINRFRVKKISIYFILSSVVITAFLQLLTLFLTNVSFNLVTQSNVLFLYSLGLSILFVDQLAYLNNQWLSKYFLRVSVIVLVFCLLDIFTPFHQVNLFLLEYMGGHAQGRFTADREAAYFFGVRRPFPLTSEPSHVSKLLLLTIPAWLILDRKKSYLLYYILCFFAFVIVRSPITVAALFIGILYQFTDKSSRVNLAKYAFTFIMVIVFLIVSLILSYFILESRINQILQGGDPSTMIRLVRPFLIAKEAFDFSPLVGVGIGNTELLAELYVNGNNLWINSALGRGYTISALLAPIAYWGVIGTTLYSILFGVYLKKRYNFQNIIVLIMLIFSLSIAIGAFNTLAFWGYVFLSFRVFEK